MRKTHADLKMAASIFVLRLLVCAIAVVAVVGILQKI
jgi:hypothetical protein